MDETKVQEEGGTQTPPLVILSRGAKIGTPGELHAGLRMPKAGTGIQHEQKDQQIGADQKQRYRDVRCFRLQAII